MRPLKEDSRDKRRTVADAVEVIRQEPEVEEMAGAEIRVSPFELPSGEASRRGRCLPGLRLLRLVARVLVVYSALRKMFAAPTIRNPLP